MILLASTHAVRVRPGLATDVVGTRVREAGHLG